MTSTQGDLDHEECQLTCTRHHAFSPSRSVQCDYVFGPNEGKRVYGGPARGWYHELANEQWLVRATVAGCLLEAIAIAE